MLVSRSTLFNVSVAEATVFQVLDSNPWGRAFFLHNRSALTLTLVFQTSVDGGANWVDYGSEFTMGEDGSGSEVQLKTVVSADLVRLRGSGGNNLEELEVALVEYQVTDSTRMPYVRM